MINYRDRVSVIGIGRFASSLAKALYQNQYLIIGLIDQDLSRAKRLSNLVKAEICFERIFDTKEADIIFICVPDDAIDFVVSMLKYQFERSRIPRFVFHCCGALTSEAFNSLKKIDVEGASFHPIQTLTGRDSDWQKFYNNYYGVKGYLKAINKASELIEKFRFHKIIIPREFKSQYHLACTIASSYLISLMAPVIDIFKKLNFSDRQTLTILDSLLSTTISNLKEYGIEDALMEPISHRDIATITKHIEALVHHLSIYESMYKLHGKILLNLKSVYENIPDQKYKMFMTLLDEKELEYA